MNQTESWWALVKMDMISQTRRPTIDYYPTSCTSSENRWGCSKSGYLSWLYKCGSMGFCYFSELPKYPTSVVAAGAKPAPAELIPPSWQMEAVSPTFAARALQARPSSPKYLENSRGSIVSYSEIQGTKLLKYQTLGHCWSWPLWQVPANRVEHHCSAIHVRKECTRMRRESSAANGAKWVATKIKRDPLNAFSILAPQLQAYCWTLDKASQDWRWDPERSCSNEA